MRISDCEGVKGREIQRKKVRVMYAEEGRESKKGRETNMREGNKYVGVR